MAAGHIDAKFKNAEHVNKLSDGNLEFALNLYKVITAAQGKDENAFFSPLSITVALAMTSVGARSQTAVEFKKALKLDILEQENDVHSAFEEILKTLSPVTGEPALPFALHMANRIFVEENFKLVADFLATLTDKYSAQAVAASFTKNAEKTRLEINGWVEDITREKIKNLLAEGSIGPMTKLVLVNAIYFKGAWKSQFDLESSHDGQFVRKNDEHIPVRMMYKKARFPFAEIHEHDCKILELPYTGDRLSMILILPNRVDGLAALESNLTADNFRSMVNSLSETKVKLWLPKFKLEIGSSLVPILKELGINDAFDSGRADFTGISAGGDLYVSDVIHKAFVDVNEEGTEAAAATAVVMMMRCMTYEPEFRADHPFLFAIYDRLTKIVLFLGRLTDPPALPATVSQKDEL